MFLTNFLFTVRTYVVLRSDKRSVHSSYLHHNHHHINFSTITQNIITQNIINHKLINAIGRLPEKRKTHWLDACVIIGCSVKITGCVVTQHCCNDDYPE